jgi:hypothetical protein
MKKFTFLTRVQLLAAYKGKVIGCFHVHVAIEVDVYPIQVVSGSALPAVVFIRTLFHLLLVLV